MLDSAGKRVAEQGQLQFLAERRERLDMHIMDVTLCTAGRSDVMNELRASVSPRCD